MNLGFFLSHSGMVERETVSAADIVLSWKRTVQRV